MHIILQNCLSLSLAFAGLSVHSRKPTVFWFFWVSALVHTLCLRKMAKEMRKQLPFDRDAIMMFYHYYNPSTWHNTASAPGTQVQVRVVPKSTHHLHMPGTRVPVSGTSTSAAPGTLVLAPLPVLQYEVPGTPGRISWTIPWHTAGFHRSVGRIFYQNFKKNSTSSTTG